ncbi:HlyD family type I secretion periplasmic adaptor subunit [Sulfurovum sp. NBC37-1]|uniref:HlyD family type I secretion periplasmic adaptor subunit n=1 Tax=Sulfurovum sp. (strain NBC37-1) TaxID=387093 RepID=UPI0001587710|nr:HlyD family type I secretion periplasmic adaptor subunit [Sulfurovum sp. NBC37-1]BAF71300.1 type I secretion membrane fusion protein [Sulfurovum sp. NBC37-1]
MKTLKTNTDVENHHELLEKTHRSARKAGIITILLIFGLFGIWSVFADIATTITANGKVITDTYNKIITHPKGGIVKKIFVHEGDVVKKGDKLLEIDSTDYLSKLDAAISQYDAALFTICRLKAEASFLKELNCDALEKKLLNPEEYQELKSDAISLFHSEMESLKSKITLLKSKNKILTEQNVGLKKHIESNKKLLSSYELELKKWKKLLKQNAVDEQKSIETERKIEQIHQQIESLESTIRENIASIDANKKQMDLEKNTFKNNALSNLGKLKLENKLTKTQIMSYENGIDNSIIKSPGEGRVTDMKIHASGEVVAPQKPIMSIVPLKQKLKIEAFVLPTDIEKIHVGQQTEISFPSFVDPSAIPIAGKISYISADSIVPEGMKEPFYRILVKFTPEGEKAIKKNNFLILPGMPTAVFVKTGKMTLLEYIMQPLIQLSKGIFHAN